MMNKLLSRNAIPFSKLLTKRSFLTLCFILIGMLSMQRAVGQGTPPAVAAGNVEAYNARALKLLNGYKYDECLKVLDSAVKIQGNAASYYYMAHIYVLRFEWEKAVLYGEKALQFSPEDPNICKDLYFAYSTLGKWEKAKEVYLKAKQTDTTTIDLEIGNTHRSAVIVCLFILVIAGIFFMPFLNSAKKQADSFGDGNNLRFSEIMLISISVSCLLYTIFFAISEWTWSKNLHLPLTDYALMMRMATLEHDGIESFLMYAMFFVNIVITLFVAGITPKIKMKKGIYLPFFAALLMVSCYYFYHIGFFPPFFSVSSNFILFPVVIGILCVGLYTLYQHNSKLSKIGVFVLIAYVGLVPIYPPSVVDFEFILAPALRLFNGNKISDIYFQYDLFLSFIACALMKLNISIDWFPYFGTISFFLFFIGSFLFADRYFRTKGLSVVFIIGLILARIYLISFDTQMLLQCTPLRLDLWIILLLVAAYKDIRHWLMGVFLGLLILFHRNLGLIYTVSYVELIGVLFLLDVITLIQEKTLSVKTVKDVLINHLKLNAKNLVIIGVAVGLCFVLFKELFSASARAYSKIGINFTQVSTFSFFWYVPVVIGCFAVLLYFSRKRLGARYSNISFFVLLLANSNLMYFYGRSHENNILNITGTLILVVFVVFDMLIFLTPQNKEGAKREPASVAKKNAAAKKPVESNTESKGFAFSQRSITVALPFIFVIVMAYYYSDRATEKLSVQYTNFQESNYCLPFQVYLDPANVRAVTKNSPNVYFMDERTDFFDFYYMGYKPQGYYNPFCSYVFKKDIIDLSQRLLDTGFYVVYNLRDINDYMEYLPYIRYNQSYEKNGTIALKKENVPYLLRKDTGSVLHVAIKDTLASPGIDCGGLKIANEFTVEVIVKPYAVQKPSAGILNSLSQYANEGLRGFAFQFNGVPDQYIFAFSNGTANVPNVAFHLDNNVWHYITATVSKTSLKVYDNGKLVSSADNTGNFVNSELPLVIGNRSSRDAHFNGYIREVKISNGNLGEADIVNTWQNISTQLNAIAPGQ